LPATAKDRFDDFEMRKGAAREGINRELQTLDILLLAKVQRSSTTIGEYIAFRQMQGATLDIIRQDLLTDLNEGGRIFGEFRRSMTATFTGSTNRFADGGLNIVLGTEDMRMWVAVLINTCPDCLERHGQIKSYAEWEAEGLPKAGATVCAEHCHCVLLPSNIAVLEPIMRGN
jgi:hypothetical protein